MAAPAATSMLPRSAAELLKPFDEVPEIGAGGRWYDYPYRLLSWLVTGWRRRLFLRSTRERFNYGLNWRFGSEGGVIFG
jgi:hypothetical protein